MGSDQTRDYKKELHHRLLALGMSDEEFLGTFLERWGNDIERSHEDELESWIYTAENDYHYWFKRFGRVQEGGIPPKKAPKKTRRAHRPKDTAGAWERQEALAQYLAGVASRDERIIGFRNNVLSGRVLSEEEALTFLSSPLVAAKSHTVFRMLGADPLEQVLDTNYQVKEDKDHSGPFRELVWGRRRSYTVRPLGVVAKKQIFPGDAITSDDLRSLRLRQDRFVYFPHPREKDRFVVAQARSILGDVANLAAESLKGYPISSEMAVWFILTGDFATEDPVRIRYMTIQQPELLSRTTITLEVESWLPPEDVLEQYRHAQRQILGGTPRSLKRKTVVLFEFVNRHKGHKGKSWSKLFYAWNKAHPGERFRDRSHLFTTYMRALEYIAGVKPTRDNDGKQLKVAGTDSHGWPIIADKWYILDQEGYTGAFYSREEAESALKSKGAPKSEGSEVLTAEQLVARLAERTKNNQPSS